MFVLQSHYRSEANFTFDSLDGAKKRLLNWRNIAALRHQIHDNKDTVAENSVIKPKSFSQQLIEALSNDLGTPGALRIIDEAFSRIGQMNINTINHHDLVELLETIDELLGLQLQETTKDISEEAKQMIIRRSIARQQQDWAKADKIRYDLLSIGIVMNDTEYGSIWEYAG
jgi:cysteinyl-tRNA synthetase